MWYAQGGVAIVYAVRTQFTDLFLQKTSQIFQLSIGAETCIWLKQAQIRLVHFLNCSQSVFLRIRQGA